MADINSPISYSDVVRDLLKSKLSDSLFTYKNWGDEDLATYRKDVRDYYRKIQQGFCAFCKAGLSLTSAANCHVEHLVPKSKRQEFVFEPKNLCVICADCNEIKRAKEIEAVEPDSLARGSKVKRYPRTSGAFLIVHPHFDIWEDHIVAFGRLFVDLSDKGHFTIGACTLNRRLREFGWDAVVTDESALRAATTEWLNATDTLTAARQLQIMKRLMVLV